MNSCGLTDVSVSRDLMFSLWVGISVGIIWHSTSRAWSSMSIRSVAHANEWRVFAEGSAQCLSLRAAPLASTHRGLRLAARVPWLDGAAWRPSQSRASGSDITLSPGRSCRSCSSSPLPLFLSCMLAASVHSMRFGPREPQYLEAGDSSSHTTVTPLLCRRVSGVWRPRYSRRRIDHALVSLVVATTRLAVPVAPRLAGAHPRLLVVETFQRVGEGVARRARALQPLAGRAGAE